MLTKINDYSLITTYVENLLATTYVPTLKVLEPNMWVARNSYYITNTQIVKSLKTQFIDNYKNHSDDFEYIDYYEPWMNVKNMSGTYISSNREYSNELHEHFGDYLRAYNAFYGVNLMPYYNCFSGKIVNDIMFKTQYDADTDTYNHKIDDEDDSSYNYFVIPVKFGKSYTIGIDFDGIIEMDVGFFHGDKYISNISGELHEMVNGFKRVSNPRFRVPFVYDMINNDMIKNNPQFQNNLSAFYALENSLRLIIRVSKTNRNPLVVIEGDYTLQNNNNDITRKNNANLLCKPCKIILDNTHLDEGTIQRLVSPLSLFQISTQNSIAFSSRLVEFLVGHAIAKDDTMMSNVSRVLSSASSDECLRRNDIRYMGGFEEGIYDLRFQNFIYNFALDVKSIKRKLDFDTFVNKDIETLLR